MNISNVISELVRYGIRTGLISELDEAYAVSGIMDALKIADYAPDCNEDGDRPLSEILDLLCDYAASHGIIDGQSIVARDLFDTRIMGVLTPRPSTVIGEFERLYKESPKAATDMFYALAENSNYIRRDRILRDMKWKTESEYGDIDITVNLSKPEKDPRAIALAKLAPQTDYPKCALCHENEGFAGSITKAPRQTLRQIPFDMAGDKWYLQYSPYVYYNEHCIALSGEHRPMRIERESFEKLLSFVEKFPHYFIGSNADLPIVGGSILSHDHMQGGRYSFAMERAEVRERVEFSGFPGVACGILRWPMSVIRLTGDSPQTLAKLADRILRAWRSYTDVSAFIYAETDGEPHNTVTPIARRRGELYELDLVLRNNITTEEHPLGVYHPHAERHNIKKENIGLIEVMGLAVLPARLKEEIRLMCEALVSGCDFGEIEEIKKHREWAESFRRDYEFTPENAEEIVKKEIGKTFVGVLRDAGVFKETEEGAQAFRRFIKYASDFS